MKKWRSPVLHKSLRKTLKMIVDYGIIKDYEKA